MKRLLGLLLGMGMVGCVGEAMSPDSGGATAQAPDADPVATLQKLDAQIWRNEQGQVIHVRLGRSQITDTGLVHLTGLTKLTYLDLRNTSITDAGIAELKKALPNCGITK